MSWPEKQLSELSDIVIGRTPPRADPRYWGGHHPWLSIADMSKNRSVIATKESISDLGAALFGNRLARPGTVLLSFKLSVGKVAIARVPLYTNEAIAALPIRDRNEILPEYLARYLESVDLTFGTDRAAMGSTLNLPKLRAISIPVPPLPVQLRISELLDRADELRTKRRRALALVDELASSLFVSMFGDPTFNPMNWPTKALGELGNVVTGNTPPRSDATNFGGELEWIKSDNIDSQQIHLTTASERLSQRGRQRARIVGPGAVLVTCIAGSPGSIGNAALADREVAFNQQINAFVPHRLLPRYALAHFRAGKRLIQGQSSGGMKGLVSKSRFERVKFMEPPMTLQSEFEERSEMIERLRSTQNASLVQLDRLFASLQHRAFLGEL